MEKFSIKISSTSLSFTLKDDNESLENFINSNLPYNQELIYSTHYISKNKNIIIETLKNLINTKHERVLLENNKVALVFLDIINQIDIFKEVIISEKTSLSVSVYEKLINNKYLKSIKCYFMPEEFVHTFANRNISVVFAFNSKFTGLFVKENSLASMRNIYYKKKIILNTNTIGDFKKFLSINRYLSVIHLYDFTTEMVKNIIDILNDYKRNRVVILIHQSEDNTRYLESNFTELKKLNKNYSDKDFREIRIIYSNHYVKNNLFKQLTYNNLKLCSVIILYLSFIAIIANGYNDFVSNFNMRLINESLGTTQPDNVDVIIPSQEEQEEIIEQNPEPEEIKNVNPYLNIPTNFSSLTEINNETVGWLSVNNTKINYPVVQANDNDYYLNRDFYKRSTLNGWIFMDYRNNHKELNKNTIIYGHSLRSGYMFGELYLTSLTSWYKNKDNLLISFNTLDKEMKWQVFSIYRVPETSDYLKVNFYDDDAFMSFVDLISERSIYNFGILVTEDDYILTLSTCASGDRRYVLHAKLI